MVREKSLSEVAPKRPLDPSAPILVIDIGNTSVNFGRWHMGEVSAHGRILTCDANTFGEALAEIRQSFPSNSPASVVIASVVPNALSIMTNIVEEALGRRVLVVGDAIPLPMDVGVKDRKTIGVDRVCAAAVAYERLQAACTIIDFGTAVTVDLVDDEGTLLGGAILPGLRLQLQSLHEYTAALPVVEPGMPELPYGRDTVEAMQTGVCRGMSGTIRGLVEGYATWLNRWPHVVATGGDLLFLAPHCDFIDSHVPDLTLRGVGFAYRSHLEAKGA